MKDIDRYRGCLVGGAAGDALGYAVEFMEDSSIFRRYGANGITEYELVGGAALISDDTQMTLFTANGLLLGATRERMNGDKDSYIPCIAACYMDWLRTQVRNDYRYGAAECSWLNNIPEMNQSLEPGMTCLNALMQGRLGSVTNPRSNSKGCGGLMRVAPIGLYFEGKNYSIEEIDMTGAQAAALTHGHELGYIPAAMLEFCFVIAGIFEGAALTASEEFIVLIIVEQIIKVVAVVFAGRLGSLAVGYLIDGVGGRRNFENLQFGFFVKAIFSGVVRILCELLGRGLALSFHKKGLESGFCNAYFVVLNHS